MRINEDDRARALIEDGQPLDKPAAMRVAAWWQSPRGHLAEYASRGTVSDPPGLLAEIDALDGGEDLVYLRTYLLNIELSHV